MSPNAVEPFVGNSRSQTERSDTYINHYYDDIGGPVLGFTNEKLTDIAFGRHTEVLYFRDLDFFKTPASVFLDLVRKRDHHVKRDMLGNVISFVLGMCFDDSVPLGESDKTITLFDRKQIIAYLPFGPFIPA